MRNAPALHTARSPDHGTTRTGDCTAKKNARNYLKMRGCGRSGDEAHTSEQAAQHPAAPTVGRARPDAAGPAVAPAAPVVVRVGAVTAQAWRDGGLRRRRDGPGARGRGSRGGIDERAEVVR